MPGDIVEQLRTGATSTDVWDADLMVIAADEIERLRSVIDTMARMPPPGSRAAAVVIALKNEALDAG